MTIMHTMSTASGNFKYLRPRHFKAARVLLAWSQSDLADRARVVRRTIVMLESEDGRTRPWVLQAVLEAYFEAGIGFACGGNGEISVIDAILPSKGRKAADLDGRNSARGPSVDRGDSSGNQAPTKDVSVRRRSV